MQVIKKVNRYKLFKDGKKYKVYSPISGTLTYVGSERLRALYMFNLWAM